MQPYRIPIWKKAPFIRIILPFGLGIFIQNQFSLSETYYIVSMAAIMLSLIVCNFLPLAHQFVLKHLRGFLLQSILIVTGIALVDLHDIRKNKHWFIRHATPNSKLVLKIVEPPVQTAKSIKTVAEIICVFNETLSMSTKGRLPVYFEPELGASFLKKGDLIVVKNNIKAIRNSGNPGAFDYARYAAFKQQYHQAYFNKNEWKLYKESTGRDWMKPIYKLRTAITSVLQEKIVGSKAEKGIAEALLIGYKLNLDPQLIQAYSNTGVVHIIAISGMHLGLIYLLLIYCCNRIPFFKRTELGKAIFIIAVLWIFSILTGASASVLRSALMFSFIILGKLFNRDAAVYNALGLSAFILLCYDPYMLWDVGFQLSYGAVLGIVVVQKPVSNLVNPKYYVVQKIWELCAVSIAAQLFVTPVCLYYFHQFPNLFLLANLVAVPLSSLLLFSEIALLMFCWQDTISSIFGLITGWGIKGMNAWIKLIDRIPFSVTSDLYFSLSEILCLYCILFFGYACWMLKNGITVRMLLFSIVLFAGMRMGNKLEILSQNKLVIYNIKGSTVVDLVNGKRFISLFDSGKLTRANEDALRTFRNCLGYNTADSSINSCSFNQNAIQFNNHKLIRINQSVKFIKGQQLIETDLLLISGNPNLLISDLLQVIKPKRIVFDASNSLWKIAQWKKECIAVALPCFSIPEEGAFIYPSDGAMSNSSH